jgi:flagellar biosynthesis/type III secretory pathway protein FliH
VRTVLGKIVALVPGEREVILAELMILSGLRHLEETVEQEAHKMPILNEILENKVLGREFKRGLQQGLEQGLEEGKLKILRLQIEKRFGALPDWAEKRLKDRSASELEELSVRVLNAETLEALLK